MDSIFGIGFPELVTILILAGIIMGPERMGRVARWLGRVTAQLQAISRGFVRQLTAELEAVDDSGEMKNAVQDIKELQRQIAELRGEISGQTRGAVQDGRTAFKDIERSITPPQKQAVDKPANGAATGSQPSSQLPNVIDVPDDPES